MIISTEEDMLAKPMRMNEMKKNTPERMMEYFLPAQLRERDDKLLPSIAPSGGRDTVDGMVLTYRYTVPAV
jgi:hypothetical protein